MACRISENQSWREIIVNHNLLISVTIPHLLHEILSMSWNVTSQQQKSATDGASLTNCLPFSLSRNEQFATAVLDILQLVKNRLNE